MADLFNQWRQASKFSGPSAQLQALAQGYQAPTNGYWVKLNQYGEDPNNSDKVGYFTDRNQTVDAWFDPSTGTLKQAPLYDRSADTVIGNINDRIQRSPLAMFNQEDQGPKYGNPGGDGIDPTNPYTRVGGQNPVSGAWDSLGYRQLFGDMSTAPPEAIREFQNIYDQYLAYGSANYQGRAGGGLNAIAGGEGTLFGNPAMQVMLAGLGAGAAGVLPGQTAAAGGTTVAGSVPASYWDMLAQAGGTLSDAGLGSEFGALAGPTASGLTLDTAYGLAGPTASGLTLGQALGSEATAGALSGAGYASSLSDLFSNIPPTPPTGSSGGDITGSNQFAEPYGPSDIQAPKEIPTSLIGKILSGAASAGDWTQLAGLLGSTAIGAYAGNQQSNALTDIYNQQRADRAPALGAFNNALNNPNTFYNSAPAMGASEAATRTLRTNAANPGDISKLAAYNLGGYNDYLRGLSGPAFGGEANQANLQVAAANANNGIYGDVSGLLGQLTQPKQTQNSLSDWLTMGQKFGFLT